MKLTTGRIVQYTLTNGDAREIAARREEDKIVANTAHAGQCYPAMVVAVFSEGYANLQVFLDGPDQHWCTSRREGDEQGTWAWPTMEPRHAAPEDTPDAPTTQGAQGVTTGYHTEGSHPSER